VRPDLLEPDTTEGIIPLGRYQYAFASLDFEVVSIRALALRPVDHPDHTKFEPDSDYRAFLVDVDVGVGKNCKKSARSIWIKASEEVYRGDERRRGARMAASNFREREGLQSWWVDIAAWSFDCLQWRYGRRVHSYSKAWQEIKLFKMPRRQRLLIVLVPILNTFECQLSTEFD